MNDFHKGVLNIAIVKYGPITLVPTTKDDKTIQKFRIAFIASKVETSFFIYNKEDVAIFLLKYIDDI